MRHKGTVAHLDVNRHGRLKSFRNVNLLGGSKGLLVLCLGTGATQSRGESLLR